MSKIGRKVKGGIFKRGGLWYAQWTAFGKKNRRSTGVRCGEKGSKDRALEKLEEFVKPYRNEDEADLRAALVERQRDAEERRAEAAAAAVAEASKYPLAKAWERHPYNESQKTRGRTTVRPLSPRNAAENENCWDMFVRWAEEKHGRGVAMQDVTAEWAREYAQHLRDEGLTPSRRNIRILVCKVMFRLAKLPNPFDSIDREEAQKAESRKDFTKEQVAKMLAAASGEWRGFLALLYYTGIRAGDAALLKAENRDRVQGKITLRTAKTKADVEQWEHPELTAILDEVAKVTKVKKGYLFPELAEGYIRNPANLSQKFTRFVARVLGETEETEGGTRFEAFETTKERTGGKRRISRYGLHSMRHTYAVCLTEAGIPFVVLQGWLGHAHKTVTERYTAHEMKRFRAMMEEGLKLNHDSPADTVAQVAELLAGADAATLAKVAELLAKEGGAK